MGKSDPKTPASAAPAAPEAAPKEKKEKKPKGPRYEVRLRDGAKNQLRFIAKSRETGGAVSYILHKVRSTEGKAKSARGASAVHPSFDEAKVAVDAGAAKAQTLGWSGRKGGGGGGSKKDVFSLDSLPTPAAAAAAVPAAS